MSGAGVRFDGQVAVFDLRAPTARAITACFRKTATSRRCAARVMGVFAPLVGIIGSMQAAEALKLLMGVGEPLTGRLLLLDALTMQMRTVKLHKDPACTVCGAGGR